MKKKFFYIVLILIILAIISVLVAIQFFVPKRQRVENLIFASDYKNATYNIEGQIIHLKNGIAETDIAPGSASKKITRYFGNELKSDLNNDGREDVVFLITQQAGGSGIFYYAVAALNTNRGYVGSDGYFLGDRIAPQTIDLSQNSNQKNVVIINYADRGAGEPMTIAPSIGKSKYLKLDADTMRWAIVLSPEESQSL